jgi:hypothetical protein
MLIAFLLRIVGGGFELAIDEVVVVCGSEIGYIELLYTNQLHPKV